MDKNSIIGISSNFSRKLELKHPKEEKNMYKNGSSQKKEKVKSLNLNFKVNAPLYSPSKRVNNVG